MGIWLSISRLFAPRESRGVQAQLRLTQAYLAVFRGSPSKEDQQIVLADLASASGFYKVTPEGATDAALRHREGMRALYGRIFSHITLNPDDLLALENAARREAAVDDLNP